MTGRISCKMVAAYLREIGIDYIPVPLRGPSSEAAGSAAKEEPDSPAAKPAVSPRKEREPHGGETLEEIRQELIACRGCPLCSGRRTVVFGVGNPHARLMFVGEGPGEEEDRQGEPFVGAAGKRLNRWIARIGLKREDVYIANIVKCRPPGNRAPLPAEAASCLPYLKRQIRTIRPEVLCTLGAVALQYLLDTNEKITRVRGRWRVFDGVPMLPTYHPAFILRNQAREHEVFDDFDLLAERLRLK
ncbi:MAG: uracil-DNA glycosylase [Deltaproteobacteria bacterium]|nr:uracil-DNA glycosylase [Deltaproteobacteria bacterium]